MLRFALVVILFSVYRPTSYGQDYFTQFKRLSFKKDSAAQLALLRRWTAARPDDAERYICYFNYYLNKSAREMLELGAAPGGNEYLELKDSTGRTAGYMSSSISYTRPFLDSAYHVIDEGIRRHPDRLDMRFGKIYVLGETRGYNAFANDIIAAADFGNSISFKWKWKDDQPLDSPAQVFLGTVQEYMNTLYNSGNAQLPLLRNVARAILMYFPRNVESLSNMAITYLLEGELSKAEAYLQKAEEIDPRDTVVLNNLAETYSRMGNKEKARSYYVKMAQYGDKETADYAKQKMSELK